MARLLSSDLKTPLSDSIIHGKSQGAQNKQRGAVVLRKALDRFLVDSQQPTLKKSEEDAATDLINNQAAAKEVAASYNAEVVGGLLQELNSLENSFLEQGYTKEYNPSNAIKNPESPRKGEESSILIRARNAEKMVESLKKQLAAIVAVQAETQNRPPESGPETATGPGRLQRASIAGRGGADPAEVRKLNRKIQELEIQLKNGGGAGGGGGNDDKKAQINEKQMQKKLKDLEASNKKATKALEMRATKAENALKKINDTYGSVTAEIDKLKAENAKLFNLNNEIASLRAKGEKCDELEAQVQSKTQELEILAEQFKKETMLRKKYKNELEDLKGAIRVYARCRPMAKYELEKGCRQVVQFKDETSMKLITSRGEKEFEFDAVFSPASTQDEVFEDTRRLVESCLDGFNVCLFAYGQTGTDVFTLLFWRALSL